MKTLRNRMWQLSENSVTINASVLDNLIGYIESLERQVALYAELNELHKREVACRR